MKPKDRAIDASGRTEAHKGRNLEDAVGQLTLFKEIEAFTLKVEKMDLSAEVELPDVPL